MNAFRSYIDHLGQMRGVQAGYTPIILEMLSLAQKDNAGRFSLYLNKAIKGAIAEKCDVSLVRVNHAVTQFVKADYLHRIGTGQYIFDEGLFGKYRPINELGENVIAHINYNTNQIKLIQ